MTAKGALAHMADVCCAVFGRYIDDGWREPWDVIRIRHAVGDSKVVPPSLGIDLTANIRDWLEQLYNHGDPDGYL